MSAEQASREPANVATLPVPSRTVADVFADAATFEHAQRVAKVFASSSLVPPHLRGNVADCLIAYQIARRLNEEPLTVFQNIYIVSGRPGWKTEYMISRANKAGVFSGRITWDTTGAGDALSVTAKAALADTGEVVSVTCDMKMARAEQWTKNAKYTSMPEHMLRWRSAAMLIRLYAPEVMLGMPVVEELETMPASPQMRDVTPPRSAAQALDDFAAEAGAAQVAAAQDAAAESPQEAPQDEAAEVVEADAAQPETASQEPAGPHDEASYKAFAEAHIAAETNADLLPGWFTGDQQKALQERCGVSKPVVEALRAAVKARVTTLRSGKR